MEKYEILKNSLKIDFNIPKGFKKSLSRPQNIRVSRVTVNKTFSFLASVVSAHASGARGPRFDPRSRRGKYPSPNTLSLVSFAGMTLDKCIVLRIRTLTGCPLNRESHPLCRLKNPTVIFRWLLVGFHPATRSVQCSSADNARKRAPGSIYIERKKET